MSLLYISILNLFSSLLIFNAWDSRFLDTFSYFNTSVLHIGLIFTLVAVIIVEIEDVHVNANLR